RRDPKGPSSAQSGPAAAAAAPAPAPAPAQRSSILPLRSAMAVRPSHHGPAALLLAVVVLSCSAAALECDFQPDCRPGETYRLPIPCEGKCAFYIQCENGVPTETRCGKFFFTQKQFDASKLECVKSTDCDWWKKLSTTTTTSTAAPTTTTGAPAPDTTPTPSSTEATSTSTTVTPEPPSSSPTSAAPSTTAAPTSTPPPSESGAAAQLAALGPALCAAAVALIL
ncbi:Levansucrase, partial [Frankliniella fusca]